MNTDLFAKLGNDTGYSETNKSNILNPYVSFNNHKNSQTLSDILTAEAIQMRGIECLYLPRQYQKLDTLFGEDLYNSFGKAYPFAAYMDSFDAYSGANTFYSKFGMSVNDEITLSVNPGLFDYQVQGNPLREGDLIYFKMDNSLFEITWVQPYDPFYQLGTNTIRKITAQKFVYSGEDITPELQVHEAIELDEFSDLDLEPVRALNGLNNEQTDDFPEVSNIQSEAKEFVKPYIVTNGGPGNPFEDF